MIGRIRTTLGTTALARALVPIIEGLSWRYGG